MENYVVLSLETHLFFARIMKEHALFLEAGFMRVDEAWIERADWFREQFEDLLREVVEISNDRVNEKFWCKRFRAPFCFRRIPASISPESRPWLPVPEWFPSQA